MSEVRLVRCPKCDKVLPEPSGFSVYQCGGCGAILRANKKSLVSDKFVEGSGEENSRSSTAGFIDKEAIVKEGKSDMASKSPSRLMARDSYGNKSPLRESGLTEFQGGLPKSPMRDRFLDDLVRTSGASSDASRSPMRERGGSDDFDHDGIESRGRSRNVSKSPLRGRRRTPGSVRTIGVSKSPMREGTSFDGVGKSPARSMEGDDPKSPLRQDRIAKMAPKASFNDWLPDDDHEGQSHDNHVREQRTWRDQAENRPDNIGERAESVVSDEHGMSSEGSLGDSSHGISRRSKGGLYKDGSSRADYVGGYATSNVSDEHGMALEGSPGDSRHGIGRHSKGGLYKDGRSQGDYVGGYARPNVSDGSYNSHADSVYGYGGGPRQSFESTRGPVTVHELQMQRTELLRKYKELKDQLSDLDDAEVSSPGFYREPDGFPMDESLRLRRRPMQQFPHDRNVGRPTHFSHSREDMYEYNFNHSLSDDRLAGQIIRGPCNTQPISKHTMPGYVPGRSLEFDQDRFESRVNDTHGHHPACGCSVCYSNDWQGQGRHGPLTHKRQEYLVAQSGSRYSMDLERHGPRVYDPRMAHTSPRGRSSYPPHNHHSKSVEIVGMNKRLCRPISGGAPFVICNNCFELLKLPGNSKTKRKDQQLQCGACSTVISFDLQQRSSDSLSSQKEPGSIDVVSEITKDLGPKHRHDSFATTSTNIGSYDFDAGGYTFQSTGSEASRGSKAHRFKSSLAENTSGFVSSPSRFSVDEYVSDTTSVRSSRVNSSEMPVKTRPLPGSPLQNHLDYSSQFKISQDSEKPILEKNTSPKGLLLVSDATETDVPFNELPTNLSQDSEDVLRESSVPGNNKGAQSPWMELNPLDGIESSSGRGSPRTVEVYVNGKAISQRAAKKAEKLAGKIQPGEYWYDPTAGFWGVMGYRCLGIIPPFIQEFNSPMPEDCSLGDSAVYVNGRELHKLDLDLLADRGLPTTRNMHYVVDISGKVLDENTRDFIVNLGRLAPSVERNKRGFGMHVPEQLYD